MLHVTSPDGLLHIRQREISQGLSFRPHFAFVLFFFFSSSQIQRPCLRFSVGSSRFDPACLRRKLILVDRNMVPARRGSEHDFLFSLSFMQEQPCVYHLSERPRVTGFAFCSLFGCQKKKKVLIPCVRVFQRSTSGFVDTSGAELIGSDQLSFDPWNGSSFVYMPF